MPVSPSSAADPDVTFENVEGYTPDDTLTFQEQLMAQLSLIRKYGSRLDYQPHFTRAVYILYTLLLPHDFTTVPRTQQLLHDAEALEKKYDQELDAELKLDGVDRDAT